MIRRKHNLAPSLVDRWRDKYKSGHLIEDQRKSESALETKVSESASRPHLLVIFRLLKSKGIVAARGVEEHHAVSNPEPHFHPEGFLIKLERFMDVPHRKIQMGKSLGLYHPAPP